MRKLITCLLAALSVAGVRAQCLAILNCPQGSPVLCDQSGNDSLLWKDSPYTWSQVLETADLYEGTVDFVLKMLPCVGGGNVNVSYVLLLDLDNDNLRETAVPSANFPPGGIVYAGNAFNPGYTGGEPVEFDKRSVPDSLKFRFALEISYSWDTLIARLCWQTGSLFVSPRLPEGRHHLIWRVEQDGEVKYCEHSFRLKDCQAPTLDCAPEWSVSLDSNGTVVLFLNENLPGAEDNTTPFPLLEFSIRKSGDGTGFPADSLDNPVQALVYTCEELDSQMVELWVMDRIGNATHCEMPLLVTDDDGFCEIPPVLCARAFWGAGDLVRPVKFTMLWVDTAQQLITHILPEQPDGCGMMTFLPPANSFSLVAECDTNPLNGVSTFDLLLISKHIIGIQPFDAAWKWIAADANKSGSVTTFDVVELRKLILGIYDKLPANTSWRFFPADCDFPANPFTAYCPPEYSFITTPLWTYPAEILFDAVKTGDVNATANPVSVASAEVESRGEPAFLRLPDLNFQKGGTYEISLQTAKSGEWAGFQFGLYFDPKFIEIETVKHGALPGLDENSIAQPVPGVLNCSWFSPTARLVVPGENLLTLRIKALASGRLSDAVSLGFNDNNFPKVRPLAAEAYSADDMIHPLQLQFWENATRNNESAIFSPQPNPTTAGVSIPVQLTQPENVVVNISDLSGKLLWFNTLLLENGNQLLEIPASVFPAPGMYVWRVQAGAVVQSGKIVKTE